MRRAVVLPDQIDVIDVVMPAPGDDEIGVRTLVAGVCGSDVHAVAGHHTFLKPPYYPGHEVVGIVEHVGWKVSGIRKGDRVTIEPTLPCWACKLCRTDRSNICENLRFFGCGSDQGGMADYFTIPGNRARLIPSDMSDLDAALIEPLATPVHAERLSGGVKNKTVLIIGAGTVGLLTLAAVRHAGAKRVVVCDLLEAKRALAETLGADGTVDSRYPSASAEIMALLGESVDVVFDCVAIQSTLNLAVTVASRGGSIMIVGVPPAAVTIAAPLMQENQIRIQGSATYLTEDYQRAIEIFEAGLVSSDHFVTGSFPLERAADAFAAAASGAHVKVVIVPQVAEEGWSILRPGGPVAHGDRERGVPPE